MISKKAVVFLSRGWILFACLFWFAGNVGANTAKVPQDLSQAIHSALSESSYEAVWQTNDGTPALAGRDGAYVLQSRAELSDFLHAGRDFTDAACIPGQGHE
ncbi:MAG: hypothetical protein C4527_03540 [Candidatus Omnitrophota bacterium]|jgi:hypothetical protein|nr:MAG: hypothetical protein C4527_03540 [Candidatus Omnitrophota bacterium]